jgi:predicted ATP-dependent endonuclease of OLD family
MGHICTPQEDQNRLIYIIENCLNDGTVAHVDNTSNDYYSKFYRELSECFLFISGQRSIQRKEQINGNQYLDSEVGHFNNFIFYLHNNNELIYDEIQKSFSKIFPDVELIATPIIEGTNIVVSLKFEGMETLIPLSECGSGFSQIMILLAVLHSQKNRIVLYDEPQTFLHPSAEKAMYDLASIHDSHQFIFTTHSSILINYPIEKNLFLVKKENGYSTYKTLNEYKEVLNEIGLHNSDFSFADKLIFVEGETEECILPKLLKTFGMEQIGYNYIILNMKGTGKEFSNRGAMNNNAAKLKMILSGLSATTPIPYLIVIDRDERNEDQIRGLHEAYGDHISILTRREIENYFLDCYEEISHAINKIKPEQKITKEIVENDIKSIINDTSDRTLYPKIKEILIRDVKGSKVMEYLFKKYELQYSKVYHGGIISSLILEHSPTKMKEVADLISPFLSN